MVNYLMGRSLDRCFESPQGLVDLAFPRKFYIPARRQPQRLRRAKERGERSAQTKTHKETPMRGEIRITLDLPSEVEKQLRSNRCCE
jgi:hypothetical protein